jgi:hypothetical protein
MKSTRILLTSLAFCSFFLYECSKSSFSTLNKSIFQSRKHLRNEKLKKQLQKMDVFRNDFLEFVSNTKNINLENRRDTLILVEYFDNICLNCNYYDITLLDDSIAFKINEINWTKKPYQHKIEVDTLSFKTHSNSIGDGLWNLKIQKNNNDPFKKDLYSKPCFDGSRAIITWILPNQKTISILADCFF